MASQADTVPGEDFARFRDRHDLFQARLKVPAVPLAHVRRRRLEAQIEAGLGRVRTLFVFAPAGYGKTMMVAGWGAAQTARQIAWLTLSDDEAPAGALINAVGAALAQVGVPVHPDWDALDHDARIRQCVNGTFALDRPVCLIIDNVDRIMADDARHALARIVEHAAPMMRFILIGRTLERSHAGRDLVYGQSAIIGGDDLRFHDDEAQMVLRGRVADGPCEAARLNHVVEGWAAGLLLAASLITGEGAVEPVAAEFTGDRRDLRDFFRREVMAGIGADDRDFLLQSALLEDFTVDQCRQVLGVADAADLIERNEAAGRFLFAQTDRADRFVYHRLFGQFLIAEAAGTLGDRIVAVHLAAADWHEALGDIGRAFHHALQAGQPERAAAMLEHECDAMFKQGRQQTVMALAAQLPDAIRNRYPRILLNIVWRYIAAWNLDQGEELLSIARKMVQSMEDFGENSKDVIKDYRKTIIHREMILALYRDDVAQSEERANILLNGAYDIDPYVKGSIYHCLLEAERMQFKVRRIDRIAMMAREQNLLADSQHAMVFHLATVSWCLFAAGRTDEAIAEAAEGMVRGERLSGAFHTRSLASVSAMALAAFRYECNDIADAEQLIEDYYGHAHELGMIDQLVAARITRARLLWLRREQDQAISALEEARHFALSKGFERLRSAAEGELVRLLLKLGRLDDAIRIGSDPRTMRTTASVMPAKGITLRGSESAMIATRLYMAQGNIADALNVIRHWRRLLYPMGVTPIELKWDVLLVEAMVLDGDRRGALRQLDRSIAIAAPAHLKRAFLDEGPIIADLVDELCRRGREANSGGADMREQLLAAFCAEQGYKPVGSTQEVDDSGLQGSMSRREMQVLNLVAQRMSNREIGDQLGLTEGSVKWYMQQIYDKFGVRRRLDVARKARQLGLVTETVH